MLFTKWISMRRMMLGCLSEDSTDISSWICSISEMLLNLDASTALIATTSSGPTAAPPLLGTPLREVEDWEVRAPVLESLPIRTTPNAPLPITLPNMYLPTRLGRVDVMSMSISSVRLAVPPRPPPSSGQDSTYAQKGVPSLRYSNSLTAAGLSDHCAVTSRFMDLLLESGPHSARHECALISACVYPVRAVKPGDTATRLAVSCDVSATANADT
mmetsp:Transcript_10336/g.25692  ORF Transcript_10336/g.25692 Transcript_10336/m.25692 type:complete len:215 (+) Transcript_10336:1281-1925(+)